jgi:hypothetical protein
MPAIAVRFIRARKGKRILKRFRTSRDNTELQTIRRPPRGNLQRSSLPRPAYGEADTEKAGAELRREGEVVEQDAAQTHCLHRVFLK